MAGYIEEDIEKSGSERKKRRGRGTAEKHKRTRLCESNLRSLGVLLPLSLPLSFPSKLKECERTRGSRKMFVLSVV